MEDDEEYCSGGEDSCQTCGGDGYGVEGEDWDMEDPVSSWTADEDGISPCPNCGGSGLAKDQRYW